MLRTHIAVVATLTLAVAAASAQQLGGDSTKPASKPAAEDTAKATVGKAAPDFALKDAEGRTYRLSDYKGKIVVMQWINPQCPVCKGCMSSGDVKTMLSDIRSIDSEVVFLPINSTHFMEAKETTAYLKKHRIDAPGLIDRDGTVGRLYGARTTPHVFVIDQAGVLRYDCAIDSKRDKPDADRTNYAVNAVRQLAAGETVSPDKTRSYGCSVKYKKKK